MSARVKRSLRILAGVMAASAVLGGLADVARGVTSTYDRTRTIRFDGHPTFPLVLSPGPTLGATTPWGTDALAETAAAGINVYKTGTGGIWSNADLNNALAWDQATAALNVYTWPNLGGYSQALPGSMQDAALANVVQTLTDDPSGSAIAMWKGRDEPWWSGIAPDALQFAYCRVTGRGDPTWCDGEAPLDPSQLWVTIEAPRGTAADLAPYSSVTDVHGVDIYPVTLNHPLPNLHRVGIWTKTLASITPNAPVWTTVEICPGASSDETTGAFILPTFQQERYMVYDAILNGAKALTFYGGGSPGCFSGSDGTYGWNWTFWQSVLEPIVKQLSARSPLAPALVNTAGPLRVKSARADTQVKVREGTSVDDIWVMAARSGTGTKKVIFTGLPSWVHKGSVYTENRRVAAAKGSFSDRFAQWDVHVYHFVEPLVLQSVTPTRATVGSRVALKGKGLAAATEVSFAGAKAHFRIASDKKLVATVPKKAKSGPIVVSSELKEVQSSGSFHVIR
jgi:hypothetical protein